MKRKKIGASDQNTYFIFVCRYLKKISDGSLVNASAHTQTLTQTHCTPCYYLRLLCALSLLGSYLIFSDLLVVLSSVQPLLVQAINNLASFVPEQIISNYDERTNCAILDDSAGFLWMYNFAVRISSIKGLCIWDNTFNLDVFRATKKLKGVYFTLFLSPESSLAAFFVILAHFFLVVVWTLSAVPYFCSCSTITWIGLNTGALCLLHFCMFWSDMIWCS